MVAEEASRLLLAARNGDLSSLKSENLTESLQDEHGATCLHYAARGGQVPVVQHLINARSFHPSKRSNVGATALHDGAATGQLEALKWLLENNDVKVDDQDGTGATVTHLSARYGHTQTLEWLLDNTNCDVLKKSASGALPLHFAAEGGHVECVKLLVSEAPRSVNMQMNNGCTPVYLACQSGHLLTAEYLASNNGTPKIHTFDGMSPLHASAQTGQLHMIKWLIQEQGLNPNERDFDGATPLHYAASKGHTELVDWMLREGGARIILDNLGGSPLHTAAEFGNNKVSRLEGASNIQWNPHFKTFKNWRKSGLNKRREEPEPSILLRTAVKQSLSQPQQQQQQEQQEIFTPIPSTASRPAPPPQQPFGAPLKSTKRPAPQPLPKPQVSFWQEEDTFESLENLRNGKSAGFVHRPPSVVSVASSASSFGYFSPHSSDKAEVVVNVDVHNSPSKVCITSSKETGEREIKHCTSLHNSGSEVTPKDFSKASASAAFYLSASSSASSSNQLPAVKPGYLPANQQSSIVSTSQIHTNGHSNVSSGRGRESERRSPGTAPKPQREESPSLAERKASLESAASHRQSAGSRVYVSRFSTMEGAKVNGTVPNGTASNGSVSSAGSSASGSAKSVIKISNKNVTIISTGKDGGSSAPKFTTTPLRSNTDHTLSGAHVSSRKKDTDFISSLAQKYQGNGSASSNNDVRPTPVASSSAYRSQATSGDKVSALSTKPSWQQQQKAAASVVATSGDKVSALSTKPSWQQQQKAAASAVASSIAAAASSSSMTVGQKRQQIPEESNGTTPVPPAASVMLNGHAEESTMGLTNGHNGDVSPPGAPPLAPPPAPPLRSVSEQTAIRKADASYSPRPKSYSTQSSTNSSMPGTPRGPGDPVHHSKNDLMAALTAAVTSGSPSASLRKTRGPGKGGINEVYSKKVLGATTPNGTPASPLPPIEEFDPKNFLDQVGDTDSAGNKMPDWKKHMLAKHMASKALEQHLKKQKEEEYESRFKNMPAWKRALIEKKEGGHK
ncbi:espin-like [Littorina saxatilis]|uniref:espin-like n=1 Tax=Littorina saxatilis TaxID=31220 RepID=UPI0038B67C4D